MALLVASLLSLTRPADACGSCECDDQPRDIINLVRGVPLNLRVPLRVLEESEAPPRLERVADGVEVAATVEKLVAPAGIWRLTVDNDLEPLTEYALVRSSGVAMLFTLVALATNRRPYSKPLKRTEAVTKAYAALRSAAKSR